MHKVDIGMNEGMWGFLGVVVGSVISFTAQWLAQSHLIKANREAERLASIERVQTVILQSSLVLPGNVDTGFGMLHQLRHASDADGHYDETACRKLAGAAASLVPPLEPRLLDLRVIPARYYPAFRCISEANSSVRHALTVWSETHLTAWARGSGTASLLVDAPALSVIRTHVDCMHHLALESGLPGFRNLWTRKEIDRLVANFLSFPDEKFCTTSVGMDQAREKLQAIARALSEGSDS